MKLYLIRHAESANNVLLSANRTETGGDADPEITERGHRQAKLLAAHLAEPRTASLDHPWTADAGGPRGYGLTHLYCSMMRRSILTARYVTKACRLPLVAHPDLFERGGIYETSDDGAKVGLPGPGRSYFSSLCADLHVPDTLDEGGWYNRPFETEEIFIERTRAVVQDIDRRHANTDDSVALVIHGDLIDQIINELMGTRRHPQNYDSPWTANWAFHNTSITRVDCVSGSKIVVYTNRVEHLPAELVSW